MDLTFIFSPCPFPDLSRRDNRRFEKNKKQTNKQTKAVVPFQRTL